MSSVVAASEFPATTIKTQRKEHWLMAIVILLGVINGLIYVFIYPPWQHYEEPSHFEYAWLIASRLSLPKYPAYDQSERRLIAASMVRHNFFKDLGFLPDLDSYLDRDQCDGVPAAFSYPCCNPVAPYSKN
jgi:hypothetical protein